MGQHARSAYLVQTGRKFRFFDRGQRARDVDAVLFQQVTPHQAYKTLFKPDYSKTMPSLAAIEALGEAIASRPYNPPCDSTIPAGYTYLGQFIFHDLSFMGTGDDHQNRRTAALDLDSVLSLQGLDTPEVGCAGSGPLATGCTFGAAQLPEDLFRLDSGAESGKAIIADPRNDDFLPLAQCHLLILKFFNAIVKITGFDRDATRPAAGDAWWNEARLCWLRHFQWVVLHDYLRRIIDRATYDDVMANGRKLVRAGTGVKDDPWLPIEFAGAIGRFGHSMIRPNYEQWNNQQSFPVDLTHFMRFTYANSEDQLGAFAHRLPLTWITNWYRLFDFTSMNDGQNHALPIMAALIDTHLSPALSSLPNCIRDDRCVPRTSQTDTFALATETMKRGLELELADAQTALSLANQSVSVAGVPAEKLAGEDPGIVQAFIDFPALRSATPLWYYTLREAEYFAGGYQLGPLAGRIVMETIHAAIAASPDSILCDGAWQPSLGSRAVFEMPDLIQIAGEPDPLGALLGT